MKGKGIVLAAAVLVLAGCRGQEAGGDTVGENSGAQQEETAVEYHPQLSDKLWEFQFAINGEVYCLPSKIEEWEEGGYALPGDRQEALLETESYVQGEKMESQELEFSVDVVNLESMEQKLGDCYVGGIVLEETKGAVLQLPGEITIGESLLSQVTEAYGTPTDEYEEKDSVYLTYEYGIYKKAELVFDLEEERLYKAVLTNYREPGEEEEINKEVPAEVAGYQEPQVYSVNPLDYVVSYGGDFYRIPAPVSQFTEKGWKILEEGSDTSVKSGKHGYVSLEKAGQVLYAVVRNYSQDTVGIENTFVTSLSGDFEVTKVSIGAGDGITLGMTEEDMKIRLGGTTYETGEDEKGNSCYSCYSDESGQNYVKFLVDRELRVVREIQVANSPEQLSSSGEEENQEQTDSTALMEQGQNRDGE